MNERILVVDDNPDILTTSRMILEANGYVVDIASDGHVALEHLKTSAPDVILLDIMMPGISGLEVLRQLKSTPATAGIPVVLVTAMADSKDVFLGYQYETDYYVTKPYSAKQLLFAIRLVLGQPTSDGGPTARS